MMLTNKCQSSDVTKRDKTIPFDLHDKENHTEPLKLGDLLQQSPR